MSEPTVDMSLAALTELVERHRRMLHQWEEREQRIDALIAAGTRSLGRLVIAENREALDALAELDDSGDYGDFKRQLLRDPATKDAYEKKAREVEGAKRSVRWFEAYETLGLLRELYSKARKAGEEELADGIADVLDVLTGWHSMLDERMHEGHATAEAAPEMERQPGERVVLRTGPMSRCAECGAAEDEPHLPGCTGAEAEQ